MKSHPERSEKSAFLIRRAKSADTDQLIALLDRYYAEWHVWEHDPPDRVLYYIEQPAPAGYLVAEDQGALVGCALLRTLASIPSALECKRLFIAPHVRGRGLASHLMDKAESLAAAHNFAWIYLDTDDQFAAAIALYRSRGYEPCERYNDNSQATFFFRKRLLGPSRGAQQNDLLHP